MYKWRSDFTVVIVQQQQQRKTCVKLYMKDIYVQNRDPQMTRSATNVRPKNVLALGNKRQNTLQNISSVQAYMYS